MNAPINPPPQLKSILIGLGITVFGSIYLIFLLVFLYTAFWVLILIAGGFEIAHA